MKRELVYGIIIAVIVVLGVIAIFEFSKRSDLKKNETVTTEQVAPKPQLRVTHSYVEGVHTYRGAVEVPTPCFMVTTSSKSASDTADNAEFEIAVSQDQTQQACAQVITSKEFSVQFKALQDARVTARVNGQEVALLVEEAAVNYYNASKDGFTFSYPLTWTMKENEGEFRDVMFQDSKSTTTLQITVAPTFSPSKILGLDGVKKTKIDVGSVSADYAIAGKTKGGTFIRVNNLTQGGRYYSLEYNTSLDPEKADVEFKSLLSGFQLVDAGVLYRNADDHFSFIIPSSWAEYKVEKKGTKDAPSYVFSLNQGSANVTAFSIVIYTKEGWVKRQSDTTNAQDVKLTEGATKVFVLSSVMDGKGVATPGLSQGDAQAIQSSFAILPSTK